MLLHVVQDRRRRWAVLEHFGPRLCPRFLLARQRHARLTALQASSLSTHRTQTGRSISPTASSAQVDTSAKSGGSSSPSWSMRTQDSSQIVIGRLRSALPWPRPVAPSPSAPPSLRLPPPA